MFKQKFLKRKNLSSYKSLADFPAGTKLRIIALHGGPWFCQRLGELGLFERSEAEIIKNDRFGPVILKIFNSKIAIGHHQAKRIYVQKI